MIVVKLMGGLGNQMFQYAFGRNLAIKKNTELKLDLSYLSDRSAKENFTFRDYELDVFNIKGSIASENEAKKFQKSIKRRMLDFISLYLPFKSKNFYLREPHFHFFGKVFSAPLNTYVDGYWQSEKYFVDVKQQLIKDFTPVKPLSGESQKLAEEIQSSQSVSIHVRRGDYISDPHNNQYHGICGENYYYEAIKTMNAKVNEPVFYVFSDEPEWFKDNIQLSFPVHYIHHNKGKNSYEDLYLMSLCKHNIIANSSFSWWGAWLNNNASKVVIAPSNWIKDKSKNTKDLLPKSWITI